jgi:hypothetical protein
MFVYCYENHFFGRPLHFHTHFHWLTKLWAAYGDMGLIDIFELLVGLHKLAVFF